MKHQLEFSVDYDQLLAKIDVPLITRFIPIAAMKTLIHECHTEEKTTPPLACVVDRPAGNDERRLLAESTLGCLCKSMPDTMSANSIRPVNVAT